MNDPKGMEFSTQLVSLIRVFFIIDSECDRPGFDNRGTNAMRSLVGIVCTDVDISTGSNQATDADHWYCGDFRKRSSR